MLLSDIPYDLEEIIEEDEFICGTFSDKFDKAMLDSGYFDYGSTRRSHRIITDKAKSKSVNEIKASLLEITVQELEEIEDLIIREYDLKVLHYLAKKYNSNVCV